MKYTTKTILVLAALSPVETHAGAIFSPLVGEDGRKLYTESSKNWGQIKDGNLCVEVKRRKLTWEKCKKDRDSQQWRFENHVWGTYDGKIYSKDNENKCLKVPSETEKQLRIVTCRDKRKQMWYFNGDAIHPAEYYHNNHRAGIGKTKDKSGTSAILTTDYYSIDFALDSSITTLTADIRIYPEYNGNIAMSGNVEISFDDFTMDFVFEGGGLERSCQNCGIHIHSGTTCSNADLVGDHYWAPAGTPDPWTSDLTYYDSDMDGNATGEFFVENGYSIDENIGHAVVIHAADGKRVGCGLLV